MDVVTEPFCEANTTSNARVHCPQHLDAHPQRAIWRQILPLHLLWYAGMNSSPAFFAVNLATSLETLLGYAGGLTGDGSFGLWTMGRAGGYLYVRRRTTASTSMR